MAFGHGKDSRVLLNETHPSGYISDWTTEAGREYADVTVITATSGHSFIPGLKRGAVSVRGPLDLTGVLHSEAAAALGTDNGALWTVFPSGFTIGQPAFIVVSELEGYSINSTPTDAVRVDITAQPDEGVEWGVSLHALGAETGDANAASVDNLASSASGGVGSLHVTAYSGLTNAVLKVQHSTDNSVWADLVTFTTVTATTSQRSTVTGTVNRYLRCATDVTGTGSVTFAMAFARR